MTLATLSGQTVRRCTVQIPGWGIPWAEVETDTPELLEDSTVTLRLADLTLEGTAVSSGRHHGRCRYRIVAGSGGWGETVDAQSYSSDYQARRVDVLRDVAAAAGELVDLTGVEGSLEGHWTRQAGPAARTLELLSPAAWYVDLAGVAHLGSWPATDYEELATVLDGTDPAAGRLELAASTLTGLLPGALVAGQRAVDVEHRLTGGALRTTVWADQGASSRLLAALDKLVSGLTAWLRLRGCWEYRVVAQQGRRLDLQPVRASTGLPYLTRVRQRLAPGFSCTHTPGSLVVVTFLDGSPSRPVVIGGDDPESPAWLPSSVSLDASALNEVLLGDGLGRVLREGDTMTLTGVMTGSSATGVTALVTAGLPLPSRVRA